MNRNSQQHNSTHRDRRGVISMELVLATAVGFTFAFGMYLIAQAASCRLYEFIATMVGSPCL